MSEASLDVARAIAAAREIIDGRDLQANFADILVTAEHAIATLLVALIGDERKAANMLNEGLVPGIEELLAFHASRRLL